MSAAVSCRKDGFSKRVSKPRLTTLNNTLVGENILAHSTHRLQAMERKSSVKGPSLRLAIGRTTMLPTNARSGDGTPLPR